MDEQVKVAFEAARDTTKQVITLATTMLFVMVAFSKAFIGSDGSAASLVALSAGIVFILSVSCGLLTLMGLTREISPESQEVSWLPWICKCLPATLLGFQPPIWSNLRMWLFSAAFHKRVDAKRTGTRPSIWKPAIRALAGLQIFAFLAGLILAVISGTMSTNSVSPDSHWIQIDFLRRFWFLLSAGGIPIGR